MICKEFCDSDPVKHEMLITSIDNDSFPNTLSPPGLTPEHKWYLFNEIRCFVSDEHKEKVAPVPDCSEPRKYVGREGDDDDDDANLGEAGPSKEKTTESVNRKRQQRQRNQQG